MPSKMAVFVEGYTELLFVEKLIQSIATANSVVIEKRRIRGGTKCRRTAKLIEAACPLTDQKHFVLIYDCGNDELAKGRMLEEYDNLVSTGYSKIVCLRDVFPLLPSEVGSLEQGLPKYVKTRPIAVDFILSVMEIEAWFLSEHTHFERVDASLNAARIHATLGFNPELDDMSQRPHPSADLHSCYGLAGKAYAKGDAKCVSHLDYSHLYIGVVDKIAYLRKLCGIIDDFLSPPAVARAT